MNSKEHKFNLNVATRITLLMNLPEQGSVIDMISQRNIRKKIDFSSEEFEKCQIQSKDGRVVWSPDASNIEVEFTESEIAFLKNLVDKLDKSGLITDNILDFVEEILK